MGVFVGKYNKQVVPKDYLEKLYEKVKPTYFGFAVSDVDDKGPLVSVMREATCPPVADIMEMQQAYKDKPMVMLFDHKPNLVEDQQPFALLTDKDDRLVCVTFVLGEFNTFAKKNSTHTAAFHANMEGVRPKLLEIYDACGGNMDDFDDELRSKLLINKLEALGGSVSIVALTATEQMQGYFKNYPSGGELPGQEGWTSDTFQEAAKPVEGKAPEPVVEKKLSALERFKAKLQGNQEGANPVIKEAAPGEVHPPGGTPDVAKPGEGEGEWRTPPAHIKSNGTLADWYKQTGGYIPTHQGSLKKARPPVWVKKLQKIGNGDAVSSATIAQVADTGTTVLPATPDTAPVRQTPDQPVVVPKPDKYTEQHTDPNAAELSPGEKNAMIQGFLKMPQVLKVLDSADEEILAPEVSAEMETNRKTLNEQIGLDGGIERWKNMKRTILFNMAGISRRALVFLFEEYRYHYWKKDAAYNQLAKLYNELVAKHGGTAIIPTATPVGPQKPATEVAAAASATSAATASTASPGLSAKKERKLRVA